MLSVRPLVSLPVSIWKAARRSLKAILIFSPLPRRRSSSATVLAGKMIAPFAPAGTVEFLADEGEATAIGGNESELAVLKVEINAVEDVARLVGGLRVGDVAQHRGQLALLQGERLVVGRIGQFGEFLGADAHDAEIGAAGGDLDLVRGAGVEGDVHIGQFAHDGGQPLDREGDGAAFLDLGLDFAADAEIEIRGGERDVVLVRLDQHVAEDGHGGFGPHDIEDLGQAVAEVVAIDLKFHRSGAVFGAFN